MKSLMNEIKIIQDATNPNETLLIADSMIGQESVNVAKSFQNYVNLTGVILTRVDGDSKGRSSTKYDNGYWKTNKVSWRRRENF